MTKAELIQACQDFGDTPAEITVIMGAAMRLEVIEQLPFVRAHFGKPYSEWVTDILNKAQA